MRTAVTSTIEISAPPSKVFSFWNDVEKRMRLNPGWEVMSIRKLTNGPVRLGSKFKNKVKGRKGEIEYISKCVEFEINKKIVTKCSGLNSDLKWKTSVGFDKTSKGTRVSYTETVALPSDVKEEYRRHMRRWLKSVKGYLEIKENPPGMFKRFLLDSFWLRWSPRQRNIAKLIILIEAATLAAALIALGAISILTRLGILRLIS